MVDRDFRRRMGYYRLRVRTHEWAQGQRVSLLDVKGIGRHRLWALYDAELSTADRIMRTATDEIVARLGRYDSFSSKVRMLDKLVRDWKACIRQLYLKQDGEPLPEGWETEDGEERRPRVDGDLPSRSTESNGGWDALSK